MALYYVAHMKQTTPPWVKQIPNWTGGSFEGFTLDELREKIVTYYQDESPREVVSLVRYKDDEEHFLSPLAVSQFNKEVSAQHKQERLAMMETMTPRELLEYAKEVRHG